MHFAPVFFVIFVLRFNNYRRYGESPYKIVITGVLVSSQRRFFYAKKISIVFYYFLNFVNK